MEPIEDDLWAALSRPHKLCGAKGTGNPCSVCGARIGSDSLEYELQLDGGTKRLVHLGCYIKLVRHRRGISGGSANSDVDAPPSDDPDPCAARRTAARTGAMSDEAANNVLPRPDSVSARKSAGGACDVCGTPIEAGDLECQLEFAGTVILHIHIDCYVRSLPHSPGISGGSADSPSTPIFDGRIALTAHRSRLTQSEFFAACAEARARGRGTRQRALDLRSWSLLLRRTAAPS